MLIMAYVLLGVLLLTGVSFAENVIRFHIVEELPVGTLVGNLAVESGLQFNFTNAELESIRYSFLDQTNMRSLFTIQERTGNVLIKSLLDRETECIFMDLCVLSFDVAIHSSSPQMFEIYSIEITIEDINDNSPKFPTERITIRVPESTVVGTFFGLSEAIDADSTNKNIIQSYELVNGNDVFIFNASKDMDGRLSLRLILLSELDREDIDLYELELLAKDGGDPIKTATLTVYIDIEDTNDNSPVFEHDSYAIDLNEGTNKQTPLLAVTAKDKDVGDNGDIVYRFSPRQSNIERISKTFSLNEKTGIIYVAGEITFGKQNTFKIIVEASDKGSQPRTSYATVTINILDTANNKPEMFVNFLVPANDSLVSISEAADIGTVIAHVTADDADSGPNGQVICAVTNQYVTLQNISGKPGYLISLKMELDHEMKQEHYISVTCSDNGSPKLSASKSFMLRVLDENDNAPIFKEATYSATIDESNPVGKYCLKVSATDADMWPNDKLRYTLIEDSKNAFSINPSSGVITANQRLDREKQDEYRFTVLAVDGGSTALTGTTVVVIVVKDVNDNKPEFDVPFFQFFIKENLPADTTVDTVKVSDDDTGNNKKIVFSLVQNPGENLPFIINNIGEIRTTASFDREEDSSFIFEVVATDQGIPALSTRIFVRVYVTDENDNQPSIIYPNRVNNTITASYSTAVGIYLTKVNAVDIDENGPNSQLTYDIVAGNDDDIFTIIQTSGKIYLRRQLEERSTSLKSLTVKVADNGIPQLQTNVTFILALSYIDSNALASFSSADSSSKNVIIVIAVVSMTIIISGALIAVICVLRRSEQIRKKHIEEHTKKTTIVPQLYKEANYKPNIGINVQENISYHEALPPKGKEIHSSYDEDLDNMELYSSFGTSVFTDTLPGLEKPGQSMEEQRIIKRSSLKHVLSDEQISGIHSLDDISEISKEDYNSDSGRGSSDPDSTRQSNMYYNEKSTHRFKPVLKSNIQDRFTDIQREDDSAYIPFGKKYYGFVDRPAISQNTNNYKNDIKTVRFDENGQFCVETSSFV
ncbi:protocadherin delta 1 [Mytilus galloprovincialis]|uniref:Protocadherin delta 1 n=2 Tax=Mytilus galloprovincialis TaxID=29158 RepID=A0A8B6FP88_MYTGA|nr:protocadherin delta 1 [Mytilus galloprovincialis]